MPAEPARPQGWRVPGRRVRRAGGCRVGASAGIGSADGPTRQGWGLRMGRLGTVGQVGQVGQVGTVGQVGQVERRDEGEGTVG
jgi:hypothetical protein